MRKSLIALVIAGFAAAAVATPAQAGKKGFGVGLGVGLVLGGIVASQHHHRHHHYRPVVVNPQPRPVATNPQPVLPAIRTSDDQGRFFDLASKTWFDGRGQCFTGTNGWSFKAGNWYYGTSLWAETDGVWQSKVGVAPTPVECASIPTIAARLPKAPLDKTATVTTPSAEDNLVANQPTDRAKEEPNARPTPALEGASLRAGLGGGGTSTN